MKSFIPTILAALSLTGPTIYARSPGKSLTSTQDFNDVRAVRSYEAKKLGGNNKRKTTNSDIQELKNQTIENIPIEETRNHASRVISTPHLNSPIFDREGTARTQTADHLVDKREEEEEESSRRETVQGEKEHEDYEIEQDDEDSTRARHDEEARKTLYQEDDGQSREDFHHSNYHGQDLEHESREKEAEFEERGEHRQGHTTNGHRVIHKKDEFEKNTEFFDESNESGEKEAEGTRDGGFVQAGRQGEKKARQLVSSFDEYRKGREKNGMKKWLCARC